MADSHIDTRSLQKGSAEMLVLSLLEGRPRHGYELSKMVEQKSANKLELQAASLYPILYKLEKKGWVEGKWIEKANERRRRFYKLTPEGKKALRGMRKVWQEFVNAISNIVDVRHA
jgi:PadR family transcriptional regulator PadR